MTKTEKAVTWAIAIADDHTHGYDQVHRWGPDYDCSSLIISAWQQAGVPVRTNGASYTGNMKSVFLACGFTDVTSRIDLLTGNGMKRGDVIINTMHHTVMYIGNGQIVGARINENGSISGGKTGDQTGKEIMVQNYYVYQHGWDCVLRYAENNSDVDFSTETISSSRYENISKGQMYAARFLCAKNFSTLLTNSDIRKIKIQVLQTALNKDYQSALDIDGIWGPATDRALNQHCVMSGETQYMVTAAEILLLLHGYNPKSIEFPGIFGSGMLAAVKTFQKAHGLAISGICDRETFLKLIS